MPIVLFNLLWEVGHLGLLNVITYLEQQGHPVHHVYLPKGRTEPEEEIAAVLSFIRSVRPSLIGFSMMTIDFHRARDISVAAKQHFPHLPIVWGGIHATFEPEESLRYADYVCVGEGEDAMLDLANAIRSGSPTAHIPNVWHRLNGQVHKNDVRPLIQNLDDYPFPVINWDHSYCLDGGRVVPLTHDLYRKHVCHAGTMYDIMVSRGCPYSCSYCCNGLFRRIYKDKGRYLRYRSVDNIIRELKFVREHFPYVNMVNIQDDGFAAAKESYLKEFSEKYRREIGLPLRLRVIPTSFTETKAKYLADANTLVAVIGLQSSERINRDVFNRHVSAQTFLRAARLLREHKIVGQYDLIVRNPYETEEDMVEVCRTLALIPKPYQLLMFPLGMFPNTPLREQAVRDGIPINEADGYLTPYGSYPIRFPYLYELQEMSPFTPRVILEFFLRHRHSRWARGLFRFYHGFIYKGVDRLRELLMRNTTLVRLVKRTLFLPGVLLERVRTGRNREPSDADMRPSCAGDPR